MDVDGRRAVRCGALRRHRHPLDQRSDVAGSERCRLGPSPEQAYRTPFSACAARCGKADSETNANARSEHRPWCPTGPPSTEATRSVALSRSLTTQALSITLPVSVTLGDSFSVPSLAAALLLGLRERMGGDPDHIAVVTVPVPVADGAPGEVRDALLLHDTVPGGTGYLTDLVDPAEVWRLLATAHRIVARCECRNENRLACHRCLLPFSRGLGAERLSRVAAERHLRSILLGDEAVDGDVGDIEAPQWVVTEGPVGGGSGESPLELRFRAVFAERMKAINATAKEKPGPSGNTVTVTLPNDARLWTLTPQVTAHGSKPDFVLRSSDPTIPPVAIFTDGWTYHASPQHNVIAEDARKRNSLRAHDYVVLGLTDADLTPGSSKAPDYDWVSPQVTAALMAQAAGQPGSGFNQDAVNVLRGGPMDFIVGWIQQPHHAPREALANAVWLLVGSQRDVTPLGHLDGIGAGEAAQRLLVDGEVPTGEGPTRGLWWRSSHVGVLTIFDEQLQIPVESVIAIDDRVSAVGATDHAASWRRWLQMSNAFAGAEHSVALVSSTSVDVPQVDSSFAADARRREVLGQVSPEWVTLMEQVESGAADALAAALAHAGVGAPIYGAEVADGIPVDFVWPDQRIVVVLDLDDETREDLVKDGWRVVDPEIGAIVGALREREGVR